MARRPRSGGLDPAPPLTIALAVATACLGLLAMVAAIDVRQRAEGLRAVGGDGALIMSPRPLEDPGSSPAAASLGPAPGSTGVVASPVTAAPPLTTGRPLKVVFLGDSVAKTTASSLQPLSGPYGISIDNRGILGCGVVRTTPFRYFGQLYDALPAGCGDWPATWQAAVDQDRPDVAVVLVGRWELMDRVVAGRWSSIGNPDFDGDVAASLDTAVAAAAATGSRVVLATTPYYHRGARPDGGTWPEDEPVRVDRFNALLRAAAARHPGVTVVELGDRLSAGGRMSTVVDGVQVRTDGVHVAAGAGPLLAPWLLPGLRALAGP